MTAVLQWGRTVCMWASKFGGEEVVRLLLESGAEVNATDRVSHRTSQALHPWLIQVPPPPGR